MKRPSFQFYPADWRNNAKLRRCSPAARGVWMDVLCLLHDADEYGLLRWPLKDIANAAGASMTLVRELVAKDVLKGADKDAEPYVYRAKHAGKLGAPIVLALADGGPAWYCSRLVRDEWVRMRRGEASRFDAENQPPTRTPKGGLGDRVGDGPTSTSSSACSEAIASAGADAPAAGPDPKAEDPKATPPPAGDLPPKPEKSPEEMAKADLWRAAVAVLQEGGCKAEAVCRTFMGKLVNDYTFPIVQQAVAAAATAQPADAREYLKGVCMRLKGERGADHGKPVTVPSDAAERTAEALRQQTQRGHSPPPPGFGRKRPAPQESEAAPGPRVHEAVQGIC